MAKLKAGRRRAGEGGLSGPLFPRVDSLALATPWAYRICPLSHPLVVGVSAIITRPSFFQARVVAWILPCPQLCPGGGGVRLTFISLPPTLSLNGSSIFPTEQGDVTRNPSIWEAEARRAESSRHAWVPS